MRIQNQTTKKKMNKRVREKRAEGHAAYVRAMFDDFLFHDSPRMVSDPALSGGGPAGRSRRDRPPD